MFRGLGPQGGPFRDLLTGIVEELAGVAEAVDAARTSLRPGSRTVYGGAAATAEPPLVMAPAAPGQSASVTFNTSVLAAAWGCPPEAVAFEPWRPLRAPTSVPRPALHCLGVMVGLAARCDVPVPLHLTEGAWASVLGLPSDEAAALDCNQQGARRRQQWGCVSRLLSRWGKGTGEKSP